MWKCATETVVICDRFWEIFIFEKLNSWLWSSLHCSLNLTFNDRRFHLIFSQTSTVFIFKTINGSVRSIIIPNRILWLLLEISKITEKMKIIIDLNRNLQYNYSLAAWWVLLKCSNMCVLQMRGVTFLTDVSQITTLRILESTFSLFYFWGVLSLF